MASPYPLSAPVRLALLALPPLLAAGLYWQGQHYDHGLVELRPSGAQSGATALTARLPASLGGRQRMGAPRPFSRDSLYEYVNGHAEHYHRRPVHGGNLPSSRRAEQRGSTPALARHGRC